MQNILFHVILWFMAAGLFAQGAQKTIAVLDLDPTGISPADAQFLSDRLRTELFDTGAFTVVEREKMNDILNEQGFQNSGCTSVDCAVQIGRMLNVQRIVAGNIGKIDDLFSISLRLIDIQSGAIVKTATRDFEGKLSEVLTGVIPEVAEILAAEKPEPAESAADTAVAAPERRFSVGLKYGWAFLTYVDELNTEIDLFAASGNEVRLENFAQHAAFTLEGKYLLSEDWLLKVGICLEDAGAPWRSEFDRFPSDIPEIKNLTDITLEREFSFVVAYLGVDYIFWQPGADQEWYIGADIGSLSMESYVSYSYTQDLIPKVEESRVRYNGFALRFTAGFNYQLTRALQLGLELGMQAVPKYDLSAEARPLNFPAELEPVVFPENISASGILLQLSAGYRF